MIDVVLQEAERLHTLVSRLAPGTWPNTSSALLRLEGLVRMFLDAEAAHDERPSDTTDEALADAWAVLHEAVRP